MRKSFKDLDEFRTAPSVSLFETLRSTPGYGNLSPEKKAAIRIANLINGDLLFATVGTKQRKPPVNGSFRRCPGATSASDTLRVQTLQRNSRIGCSPARRPTSLSQARRAWARRTSCWRKLSTLFASQPQAASKVGVSCFISHWAAISCRASGCARRLSSISPSTEEAWILIRAETFRALIKTGDALVILDGLDEMVRNHGEDACGKLVTALREEVDPAHSTIVLACRDHIYLRLRARGLVPADTTVVAVPPLSGDALASAIAK